MIYGRSLNAIVLYLTSVDSNRDPRALAMIRGSMPSRTPWQPAHWVQCPVAASGRAPGRSRLQLSRLRQIRATTLATWHPGVAGAR